MEPSSLESLDDVLKRGGDLDDQTGLDRAGVGLGRGRGDGSRGAYHIGAVVRCPSPWDGEPRYEAMMTRAGLPYMDKCQVRIR